MDLHLFYCVEECERHTYPEIERKEKKKRKKMKLFENAKLDRISTALCMNTADCKIRGR